MVKISTNSKNFIETITKGLSYTKTEIDTKLANKANTGHNHTSTDIDLDEGGEDNIWIYEYGISGQSTINCAVFEHEKKLENIDDGANKTVVDSSLSSSSINPVQNKVVKGALDGKANSSHSHSISNITNLQSALNEKAHLVHNHNNLYYTEAEIDEKLNGKADNSHSHSINDVTGLSTSLDGKMNNDYSESTIESNFFAHKIGNIVIVTWWGGTLPTKQNSWVDWKTLPYKSCNTQPIWVNGDGHGCEVRVRVPPNSNKLQVFIDGGTGGIRPGMIVYPTK